MTPDPFYEAIAADADILPPAVRAFHTEGPALWHGEITVERGASGWAKALCSVFGFPMNQTQTPFVLSVYQQKGRWYWIRLIGNDRLTSEVNFKKGVLREKFGPVRVTLTLKPSAEGLHVGVKSAKMFGVPLPRWFVPVSDSMEGQDPEGRFTFDISASLPWPGALVRYHGFLARDC